MIAASLLTKEDVLIKNVPRLVDIENMLGIIKSIGGRAQHIGGDVFINCRDVGGGDSGQWPVASGQLKGDGFVSRIPNPESRAPNLESHPPSPVTIAPAQSSSLRASIFMLGPAIARFNCACVGLPGGCAIGNRPIDIHIAGLKALNVRVAEDEACVYCDGSHRTGGVVRLRFPSVGATENLMMASALGKGKTTLIFNAAREPEIEDLAHFINCMGGRVFGAGTSAVRIEGMERLGGCGYRPNADRIAAATFLTAVATAGGEVCVTGVEPQSFSAVTEVFKTAGCTVKEGNDYVTLNSGGRLRAVSEIATEPFPGFPTDMQAPVTAMLCTAQGKSVMRESVFESRFHYAAQLQKMGAKIAVAQNNLLAVVEGVEKLRGAQNLEAEDLRGGAALVIAALSADGESTVSGAHHIDRGYEALDNTLSGLGADIKREPPGC